MHDFVGMLDSWSTEMRRVPRAKLAMLMRLGAAIAKFVPARADRGARPNRAPQAQLASASSETEDAAVADQAERR